MKKKALLFGLNYRGTESELGGCINDTIRLQKTLQTYLGYSAEDITLLTDDTAVTPTKANMEKAFETLLTEIKEQDIREVWISYSGHGSYVTDTSGDEQDGQDEVLVPLDYTTNGFIHDDWIHAFFEKIPATCFVVPIWDACHSGSMGDLQWLSQYSHTATKRQVRRRVRVRRRGRWVRVWRTTSVNGPASWKWEENQENKTSEVQARILSLSGCRDQQTSADVFNQETNSWGGALTNAIIEAIESTQTSLTCKELCLKVNEHMKKTKMTQRPVIASTFKLQPGHIFFTKAPCCITTSL